MSSDGTSQTTLNFPSIFAFAILSFFFVRYFFFTPSTQPGPGAYPANNQRRLVPPERIEQVLQMFPQLSRRDVEWDLLRNGGSVQATTEAVLTRGRLDVPPPNFRGQEPPAQTLPQQSQRAQQQTQRQQPGPQHPDLITRYNLSTKITSAETPAAEDETKESGGWSQNKVERQAILKRRREEMILQARRKMQEKDKAKTGLT